VLPERSWLGTCDTINQLQGAVLPTLGPEINPNVASAEGLFTAGAIAGSTQTMGLALSRLAEAARCIRERPALVSLAVLEINRTNTILLAGVISGTGSLTQLGPGTLVLVGGNTYMGSDGVGCIY
jgi:hypothetical protein